MKSPETLKHEKSQKHENPQKHENSQKHENYKNHFREILLLSFTLFLISKNTKNEFTKIIKNQHIRHYFDLIELLVNGFSVICNLFAFLLQVESVVIVRIQVHLRLCTLAILG